MSKSAEKKRPLSAKTSSTPVNVPEFFMNTLAIPPNVAKELADKNLEGRWIDYRKYISDGNNHSKGWSVYRKTKNTESEMFQLGESPDGIIRRGTMVLATRPIEWGNQHRAYLEYQANLYKGFKKSKANELRQKARDHSVDSIIDDSFDDDSTE